MQEFLERIMKEKTGADHLLYVSLKYTKTCDVIINLIKRWKNILHESFEALFVKAKRKKEIKSIPKTPIERINLMKELFKEKKEVLEAVKLYEMFRLIESLPKKRENEFRKGVCLKVIFRGKEISINLEKLKSYNEILENFINFVKLSLLEK